MAQARFRVAITAEDYQVYYQGQVSHVQAVSFGGKQIRFHASHLRPYLQADGVNGEFILEYDENNNNKFVRLHKIGD